MPWNPVQPNSQVMEAAQGGGWGEDIQEPDDLGRRLPVRRGGRHSPRPLSLGAPAMHTTTHPFLIYRLGQEAGSQPSWEQ